MTDRTLTFLLGYLRQTQWACALKESTVDIDRVRELMQEMKEAYGLDIGYIEQMAKDEKLLKYEMKQDKV